MQARFGLPPPSIRRKDGLEKSGSGTPRCLHTQAHTDGRHAKPDEARAFGCPVHYPGMPEPRMEPAWN